MTLPGSWSTSIQSSVIEAVLVNLSHRGTYAEGRIDLLSCVSPNVAGLKKGSKHDIDTQRDDDNCMGSRLTGACPRHSPPLCAAGDVPASAEVAAPAIESKAEAVLRQWSDHARDIAHFSLDITDTMAPLLDTYGVTMPTAEPCCNPQGSHWSRRDKKPVREGQGRQVEGLHAAPKPRK